MTTHIRTLDACDELDIIRAISREACRATDAATGWMVVADTALKMAGVCSIQICDTTSGLDFGLEVLQFANAETGQGAIGTAIAPLGSSGCPWGELRIEFNIASFGGESPVRFAVYVAQQLSSMLRRIQLLKQRKTLRETLAELRRSMAVRKAVQRAAGLLARAYALTEQDAAALLIQQSQDASRPVHRIAEQIITSHRVSPRIAAHR